MATCARLVSKARATVARYQFEITAAVTLLVILGGFAWMNTRGKDGDRLSEFFSLWMHDFQAGMLVIFLVGVLHALWPRRGAYWDLLMTNPIISLEIVVLLGITFGKLLPDFGFFYMVWGNPRLEPLVSSWTIVVTIAVLWLFLYFLYVDSYDPSLDVDPADPQTAGGLGRDEQADRRARRLWREFDLPLRRSGHQPGWIVYHSTRPLALLLAIPALLPRYAVVRVPLADPAVQSLDAAVRAHLEVAVPWLIGLGLGLGTVVLARRWITRAARLEWWVRAQKHQATCARRARLGPRAVVVLVAPLLVGGLAAHWFKFSGPGLPLLISVILVGALAARARHIRNAAGPNAGWVARRLYGDYLSVLTGVLVLVTIVAAAVAWADVALASTFCICYLLILIAALVAAIDWVFTSQPRASQIAIVGMLMTVLVLNGINPFKIQFGGLSEYPTDLFGSGGGKRPPVRLACFETEVGTLSPGCEPPPPSPMIDDVQELSNWEAYQSSVNVPSDDPYTGKPKLVVVACSGGALRAAIWTALVLGTIEEEVPEFPQNLRLITGASGGMLGAAHYVLSLQAEPDGVPRLRRQNRRAGLALATQLHSDFWGPAVRGLVFEDLFSVPDPRVRTTDRGRILERSWENRLGWGGATFAQLAPEERRGVRPSLVFTPMMVEDSRRLFISNLDLRDQSTNHGRFDPVTSHDAFRPDEEDGLPYYSRTGVQFFRLFPGDYPTFHVSTAVRMSATFPLISPTVNLPTDPPRRVVDAGYYDNYGVDLAVSWLEAHRDWLLRHTSGVALVQIRAFTNEDTLRLLAPEGPPTQGIDRLLGLVTGTLDRGTQFLTSPLAGVANARQMVMSYRNDAAVETLKRRFTFDRLAQLTGIAPDEVRSRDSVEAYQLDAAYPEAQGFFRIFTFTCGGALPHGDTTDPDSATSGRNQGLAEVETMNWFVSRQDFQRILDLWRNDANQRRFGYLLEFLNRKRARPGTTRRDRPDTAADEPAAATRSGR